jgi:hypothetical protein
MRCCWCLQSPAGLSKPHFPTIVGAESKGDSDPLAVNIAVSGADSPGFDQLEFSLVGPEDRGSRGSEVADDRT